jgi:Icc-related predicted phosphoesterase
MPPPLNVCCISDLHGQLPTIDPCDLLLIAGDICPNPERPPCTEEDMRAQARFLDTTFRDWLNKAPATNVVAIAGNHDMLFERMPEIVPSLRWHYLQRSSFSLDGISIWGSPDQLPFYHWAFNTPEEDLARQYEKIPAGTDILLSHGPPLGYGDRVPDFVGTHNAGTHVGSQSLTDYIEKKKPRFVVTGHIHGAYGTYRLGPTTIINAAVLDEAYQLTHKPIYFEIMPRDK